MSAQGKTMNDPEVGFEVELERSILAMDPSARRLFEHHEREPHYLRRPLCAKTNDLIKEQLGLDQITLADDTFNFEASWFSLLWTC